MAALLIVDEDPVMLGVLVGVAFGLPHLPHRRVSRGAVERLAPQDYDVIVSDISMPGMSGEDLLGFVRANRPATPVVFISGSTDEERAGRLLTRGAFDYPQKPSLLEEITGRVARAAAHRRPPPGLNS